MATASIALPDLDFNNVLTSVVLNGTNVLKNPINFSNAENLVYRIKPFINPETDFIKRRSVDGVTQLFFVSAGTNILSSITVNGTVSATI